jgi:hypothetical protein
MRIDQRRRRPSPREHRRDGAAETLSRQQCQSKIAAQSTSSIGVERSSGKVVLTISDHLDWANDDVHIAKLEAKIETYVAFVESGEILASYPDARNRAVRIDVVMRESPSVAGARFLAHAREVLRRGNRARASGASNETRQRELTLRAPSRSLGRRRSRCSGRSGRAGDRPRPSRRSMLPSRATR